MSASSHSLRTYAAPMPSFVRCCSKSVQNVAARRMTRRAITGHLVSGPLKNKEAAS